jgi:hypothetical protein
MCHLGRALRQKYEKRGEKTEVTGGENEESETVG